MPLLAATALSTTALAVAPPAVATCDGTSLLAELVLDPLIAEIELEPDCDHSLRNAFVDRPLTLRGQPPATGQLPARIVYTPGPSGENMFLLSAGGDLRVEQLDLYGVDGAVYGGRVLYGSGGTAVFDQVNIEAFHILGNVGGAFLADDATVTLSNATLTDIQATHGGALWASPQGEITLEAVTTTSVLATGTGGLGFAETGGTLRLYEVVSNDTTGNDGGLLGARGTLVVDGLVSDGHQAVTGIGGAFVLESSTSSLSLCDAVLTNGSSVSLGGAIFHRGPVTIGTDCDRSSGSERVVFDGHSALGGGAIYADGSGSALVLDGVDFRDHTADFAGGTIHAQGGTITTVDVTIDGSHAGDRGGAIYVSNAIDADLVGIDVLSASAVRDGGCVAVVGGLAGSARLVDSQLTDCWTDASGGGVFADNGLTIDTLSVTAGGAGDDGGGIHLTSPDARTLSAVTLLGCYAGDEGGGLSVQGSHPQVVEAFDLTVEDCDANQGGALALRDSLLQVDGGRLQGAQATEGSAAYVVGSTSVLDLNRTRVCDSFSGIGSIYAESATPTITMHQVAFVENQSVVGGALYLRDLPTTTVTHAHFVGNEATEGSVLFDEGIGTTTFSTIVAADNHAAAGFSGAFVGASPTDAWYENNTPVADPTDPSAPDVPAGMLHDGSCTWAALRTVDRAEAAGVWAAVIDGDDTTWPDDEDPFRDSDGDGVPWMHDCDDDDPARAHTQLELCDGIDNDCDGLIDDADPDRDLADTTRWYIDLDGDERGDENGPVQACDAPEGYVDVAGDCDDTDNSLPLSLFIDNDGDLLGAGPATDETCTTTAPPGFSFDDDDCDDNDPSVQGPERVFLDADGDGAGSQFEIGEECPGSGAGAPSPSDCDDRRSDVFPGAPETCDGVDQDCDGEIDEGVLLEVWDDADGDGVGSGEPRLTCDPGDDALIGGDCNDGDPERTFDCDEATATYTGDDDDDDPGLGATEPPVDPSSGGIAQAGCACDGQPRPAAGLGALFRRR